VKRAKIALSRYIGVESERPLANAPDVTRVPLAVAHLDDGRVPGARCAFPGSCRGSPGQCRTR
jgi:hypothetical protein